MPRWYYRKQQKECGPVRFRDLTQLVRDGALSAADLVRPENHAEWQRADTVIGLFYMSRRSPDDLAELDRQAAAAAAPAVEMEPAPPPVETRPNWMLRLLGRSGRGSAAQRQRPVAGAALPGEPAGAAAFDADAATAELSQAPFAAAGPSGPAAPSAEWTGAVDAALAAMHARDAGEKPGRFGRWFGRVMKPLRKLGTRRAVLGVGFRLACAVLLANFVADKVDQWSDQQALRFPEYRQPTAAEAKRAFPLLGECGSFEYTMMQVNLMLAAGLVAYAAAGWLERRAE